MDNNSLQNSTHSAPVMSATNKIIKELVMSTMAVSLYELRANSRTPMLQRDL